MICITYTLALSIIIRSFMIVSVHINEFISYKPKPIQSLCISQTLVSIFPICRDFVSCILSLLQSGVLRCWCLGEAPLAASVLQDYSYWMAVRTLLLCTSTVQCRQTVVHQVTEKVSSEAHVDPGVTTTVQAGQQHGNNEWHF